LSLLLWGSIARVVRGATLALREREFVDAARAIGATNRRIIVRHVLPNCLGPITVNATLVVAEAILVETTLSFLGFGIQPPTPSWGNLLVNSVSNVEEWWWLVVFPGAAIFLTVLGFNFLGDGLRDAADPPSPGSGMNASSAAAVGGDDMLALQVSGLVVEFPVERAPARGRARPSRRGRDGGVGGESGSGVSERARGDGPSTRPSVVAARCGGRQPVLDLARAVAHAAGRRSHGVPGSMTSLNRAPHRAAGGGGDPSRRQGVERRGEDRRGVARTVGSSRRPGARHRQLSGPAATGDARDGDRQPPRRAARRQPTTALDVTTGADPRPARRAPAGDGPALLLITHDLGVVAGIADRGGDVRRAGGGGGSGRRGVRRPRIRTRAFSTPSPGARLRGGLRAIAGSHPINLPPGCAFAPRCGLADARCIADVPELRPVGEGHSAACVFGDEIATGRLEP
jgi:hypothetical protein